MREGHHQITYRAMPPQARFGFFTRPLHDESCYTQEELHLREAILAARSQSGLDPDLLRTDMAWFSPDNQVALVNVNEGSWIFGNEYRPRQGLSRDDFHIGLINRQLHWPALNTMTRFIGDYLLIRNNQLDDRHLNQPLNYVFLDAVQILNRMAVIHDGRFVNKQLQLLNKYLRVVETHVSPTQGSDRLFLADCRYTLEHRIAKDIENKQQSQQLKLQFEQVRHQLNRVAELRHTVLHFALTDSTVNPHPYWEHFSEVPRGIEGKQEFPTLSAKHCAEKTSDALAQPGNPQLSQLKLTPHTLDNCPALGLIDKTSTAIKAAYGQSISDLQEVLRFQHILDSLLQLFDQAGEVFTLIQLRRQMNNLLLGIEQFVQQSEQHIVSVVEANSRLYHQLIQDKQDLSWWERMTSGKAEKIDRYINNQDNLARFPTSSSDLSAASKELLDGVHEVLNHLKQQGTETQQVAMVSSTRELVQHLMDSMHAWVGHQQEINGLPIPDKPALILSNQQEQPAVDWGTRPSQSPSSFVKQPSLPQASFTQRVEAPLFFQAQSQRGPVPSCLTNQPCTAPLLTGNDTMARGNPFNTAALRPEAAAISASVLLGTLVLLPLVFIGLKLLYDAWQRPAPSRRTPNNKENFNHLATQAADLLSAASHLLPQEETACMQEEFDYLSDKAKTSQDYDNESMSDLVHEIKETLSPLKPGRVSPNG
ncbi:hypothetical protein [Legionella taurinensis]|uniref:Uncharacterized protein n=1 Tax=Legionella taurinensis TaxID=70611 RepID=A0A3A5LFA1_9GAMM|nr:hypothetical protein [Legionella taurinensis]RJT47280.1 hypothetical protein D6J04_06835 [Legionella taurinensis]RJT68556.1 hypothetical protein D6J03_03745 [Legionella taurinensis]STY27456.1 Uncharacterised protein [Legionella taurinensis]